ncbi:MAG: FAD-binding protein [Blastochloris sp.]|nr:FAD-binding protein [Blastochloris sp.]
MVNPLSLFSKYLHWLHTRWPAGRVEQLPDVQPDGTCSLPGVRIVGDLTGIPLLKFSAHSGARAVQSLLQEPDFIKPETQNSKPETLDLAIIGAGVSGVAAAIEAKKHGLNFRLYEATQIFSTVANFPKRKPIYTYPTGMTPAGDLQFSAQIKEDLLAEMEQQRQQAGVEITEARIERIQAQGNLILLHHGDGRPPRTSPPRHRRHRTQRQLS